MEVTLVGKKKSDFKSDNGEQVKGIKLYYICRDEGVEGFICADVWIGANNTLYSAIDKLNLSAPVEADMMYGINPSSKKAKLMAIEILAMAEELSGKK